MPENGLSDFVQKYHQNVKKKLGSSPKDRAIIEALSNCEEGILDVEKREANILPLS